MRARSLRSPASAAFLGALAAACASVDFEPTGETNGTFRSSALTLTVLGHDFPESALMLARQNASDSTLPNMVVDEEIVFPYLWRLDWLLDILCVRWATVSGTYGPAETR
jgi:hypothetical protein